MSPTYFEVLGIPLRSGRAFSGEDDGEGRGVAIVNETFARELLPGKDPLGESIRLATGEGRWLTIVGVAADARQRAVIDRPIRPEIHVPLRQAASRDVAFLVRSPIDPESLTAWRGGWFGARPGAFDLRRAASY